MEYQNLSNEMNETSGMRCNLFEGDVSKCEDFVKIQIGLGTLSVISCLAVIIYTFTSGNYKVLAHRLVLYQAIASLVESVCQIFNWRREYGPLCTFFGWLIHFTEISLLMWVVCISIHAFVLVKKGSFIKKEYVLHLLGWGFPLFLSLLPFTQMKFGPAGMWCWIVHDWPWRMSTFYIPVYVITFAMIVLCSFTIYYVHKMANRVKDHIEEERKLNILKMEVHLIIIYPFVYLALELVPLIHRIHNAVHGRYTFAMVVLHGMSLSLRGFINAVVFIIANKNGLVIMGRKKAVKPPIQGNINIAFNDHQPEVLNPNELLKSIIEQMKTNEDKIAKIKEEIEQFSVKQGSANNIKAAGAEKDIVHSHDNTKPVFVVHDEAKVSHLNDLLKNLTEQIKINENQLGSIQQEITRIKQNDVN